MLTIQLYIDEAIETLGKNIANDLLHLEFDAYATDEEVEKYYGGGVNRLAMVEDTKAKLESNQLLFHFLQNRKQALLQTYANQYPDADFTGAIQRAVTHRREEAGHDTDVAKSVK